MKLIPAIKFYKEIEKDQDKYKLVNGGFIVRYLDENISVLVGDFEKAGSVFNQTTINKIRETNSGQNFNKKANITLND